MGNTGGRGCRCFCLGEDSPGHLRESEGEELRSRLADSHTDEPFLEEPTGALKSQEPNAKENGGEDGQTAPPSEDNPTASSVTDDCDPAALNFEPSVEARTPTACFAALRGASKLLDGIDTANAEQANAEQTNAEQTNGVAPGGSAPPPAAAAPAAPTEAPAAEPAEAAKPVTPVLPAEFKGLWEGIPNTLEGLEAMLDLQGVGWMQKKMVLKMAPSAKPKMEISNDGSKVLVVITKPNGKVESKEFVLDGDPFETTVAMGEKSFPGTGQAELGENGTAMILQLKHDGGAVKVTRRIVGAELVENMDIQKGDKSIAMKRRFKKIS